MFWFYSLFIIVCWIILVFIKTWSKRVELPKIICNLGQKIAKKSTKLSKIGFLRNISQLTFRSFVAQLSKVVFSNISEIPLKFVNFLRSSISTRWVTRKETCIFSFWWQNSSSLSLMVNGNCAKT